MSLLFFFVCAVRHGTVQDELNTFLAQARELTLTREFGTESANSGWAVCVEVAANTPELSADLRHARGSLNSREANRKNPGMLIRVGWSGPLRTPPGYFVPRRIGIDWRRDVV